MLLLSIIIASMFMLIPIIISLAAGFDSINFSKIKEFKEDIKKDFKIDNYLCNIFKKEFYYESSWDDKLYKSFNSYWGNRSLFVTYLDEKLKEIYGEDYKKIENAFIKVKFSLLLKEDFNDYKMLFKLFKQNEKIEDNKDRFIDFKNIINTYFHENLECENLGKKLTIENCKVEKFGNYIFLNELKLSKNKRDLFFKNSLDLLEIIYLETKTDIIEYYIISNMIYGGK